MTSPALQTALAYHRAWSSHDVDAAMALVAPDVVCDAPAGTLVGRDRSARSWARSRR
ncbi:nuclear transport factor 2 family protein [Cellulomonas sp. URHB0016]